VNVSPANTNPKVTDRLYAGSSTASARADAIQDVVGEQFAFD